MTQKEILEGNKLIACFVGLTSHSMFPDELQAPDEFSWMAVGVNVESDFDKLEGNFTSFEYYFKFHASYDWLVPVLNKIEQHKNVDTISICFNCGCDICFKGLEVTQIPNCWTECSKEKSLIECCFESVVKFIKWYNQQNKQL